jgi:hypothetical protein
MRRTGFWLFWIVVTCLTGWAATPQELFRSLELNLRVAQGQDVPLLAPGAFRQAQTLYEEARQRAARGGEALQISVAAAERSLAQAVRKSDETRKQLAYVLLAREAIPNMDPSMSASISPLIATGNGLLRDAASSLEAGNVAEGERLGKLAQLEYSRAAKAFLRQSKLPEARAALNAAQGHVQDAIFAAASTEMNALTGILESADPFDVAAVAARIQAIIIQLYPPFFRNPPLTLTIGAFTLYVEKYDRLRWDFVNGVIVGASGTAYTSFSCAPKLVPLYPGILTTMKSFRVVETVRDPLTEISVSNAKLIEPEQGLNSTLTLSVPTYAQTAGQFSQIVGEAIKFKPKGDILVHFDNLTIKPGLAPGTGIVLAGTAAYPTSPPHPAQIRLALAGFTVVLSALNLTPLGATATGELVFPVSIVDPGSGHPGQIPLGNFAISSDCEFHKELPTIGFGPWSVGNTEMLIQGTGVIADFDKTWAAPGLDPSSAAALAPWRGAILNTGSTIPASTMVISNSGYLRASYTFAKAEVTGPGLKGHFVLAAPYDFTALQPVDYKVHLGTGTLDLTDSAVAQAFFQQNNVIAPLAAAENEFGSPIVADCPNLSVDSNLDLLGGGKVSSRIRWGEFTKHSHLFFYDAARFTRERFYLSGTYKVNYFPVDSAGNFGEPNALAADLRLLGIQGLSVFLPEEFVIHTTDTPGALPLKFQRSEASQLRGWLNISFGGVHGSLDMTTTNDSNKDLGPIGKPFYVGNKPFQPAIRTRYHINTQFVSSTSYLSDISGKFHIPQPIDGDLDFTNLAFTSTALISGAKVPFTNPLPLSYWGLDMVKKPGATSAGVISVRTGQVFFTAAGIRELRHFDSPFYLVWGEMLADGALKRLVFDYGIVGQKFDRFNFTTSFVRLSDFDPAKEAFLKVAGTTHFDLFGPKYINLNDFYDPTKSAAPYNSRRLDDLMTDSDPGGAFQASDQHLAANWSGGFSSMDFNYNYDKASQDGFVGAGRMGFLWIDGTLPASIVMKAERECMTVSETTHHDFKAGPVAHFGSMTRITGCGCIENGQLQRVNLSSELEPTADVNILLRAASYGRIEWSLTPTVSTLEIAGDMYLTILATGNIEVTGLARFTIDREQDFVEGELNGKLDMGSALGLNSLTADGQLNWHLGAFGGSSYQSIQGRLAVQVVSPLAGVSAEGGFYAGINAPKSEAWVLANTGDRFKLNTTPLPDRLTGVYGFAKVSRSINKFVFSGGMEAYAGLGAFVLSPQQVIDLSAQSSGPGLGLPFVVGNVGLHIWGEILGGLVSAGATADLNVIAPYPFSFQGTFGLEGCVVWVVCGSVDVTAGLNSSEGLFVR